MSSLGILGRPVTTLSATIPRKPQKLPFIIPPSPTQKRTSQIQSRPKTRASLGVKNWRANIFPVSSPASKREVELLGEWLNSVLAENLELNESPIDVCTNAQHWFSVAFNELLRQVSVSCAERGRLFAVIWKRNQDLLSKLVQIQKNERQYILDCHKDRMQFLKTDLDFCKSRLETVNAAYNEELDRWKQSHERDISKFSSLQEKIDEQVKGRKQLIDEIKKLKEQLGIIEEQPAVQKVRLTPYVCHDTMINYVQSIRSRILSQKTDLEELNLVLDNIELRRQFLNNENTPKCPVREKYARFLLSLPADMEGEIKSVQWLSTTITYIYSNYLAQIERTPLEDLSKTPLIDFTYDLMLSLFGVREAAEAELLNILVSAETHIETCQRVLLFCRFIGIRDPVDISVFHFYLYCLSAINKEHQGPLFPEVEANDSFVSGCPIPAITAATEHILGRFTEGRTYKFYTERVQKIASDGYLRFGGRNLAELDQVLMYLVDAYIDEEQKLADNARDLFENIPDQTITTYSQFNAILQSSRTKLDPSLAPVLMIKSGGKVRVSDFTSLVKPLGFFRPLILKPEDFLKPQNTEDVFPYVRQVAEDWQPKYDAAVAKVISDADEVALKQIKGSKAKLESALNGRSLGRTFVTVTREFFERVYLSTLPTVY